MPKELPSEIMALINTVFKAFNSKSSTLFKSVYGTAMWS